MTRTWPHSVQEGDRRSACPGMFRLAPAKDGAICRVKLAGGRLSADQARDVAHAAAQFSTALIELTNRANFQIRAIQSQHQRALIEALMAAGLGPLPSSGDAVCTIDDVAMLGSDDVRNVMLSPMAGRDPQQTMDALPLADRLLTTLQGKPQYHALSPKFAVQIDAGESVARLNHPHDIWVSLTADDQVVLGLASCMPVAGDSFRAAGDVALAAASAAVAHDLVCAAIDLFLDIAKTSPDITRMKQVPAERAGPRFIDALQQRLSFTLRRDAGVAAWQRAAVSPQAHLGIIAESDPAFVSIGGMATLGRIMPQNLEALADIARQHAGYLLLTPWQSVIMPGIRKNEASAALREIGKLLQVDPAHPAAQTIACTGSQGCASGHGDTQADGVALIDALSTGKAFPVHLTGCSKSCAAIRAEPATLVATNPGTYDLYHRDTAADTRFGRLIARNLTISAAATHIADFADDDSNHPNDLTGTH